MKQMLVCYSTEELKNLGLVQIKSLRFKSESCLIRKKRYTSLEEDPMVPYRRFVSICFQPALKRTVHVERQTRTHVWMFLRLFYFIILLNNISGMFTKVWVGLIMEQFWRIKKKKLNSTFSFFKLHPWELLISWLDEYWKKYF